MGLWKSLAGYITVEVTTASVGDMLSAAGEAGVELKDVIALGDLDVRLTIYRRDIKVLRSLLSRRGDQLRIVHKGGIYWAFRNALKRPVMCIGMILLIFLAIYLPTRVLFVLIDGNATVPAQMIIEKAAECGVGFGASRRDVRSEQVKNALLSAIPQLQWAGVNTYGCLAVITVEERQALPQKSERVGVSSIVAARDGVISKITAKRGNVLCRLGQAVQQGQMLVSGYTDCGILIRGEIADAEIYAETLRVSTCVTPTICDVRDSSYREESYYSVRIGKNIINLYKDSGILDTTCVRIYEEKCLELPGGFQLPVTLLKETVRYYENSEYEISEPERYTWLQDTAMQYLQGEMVAGRIVQSDTMLDVKSGLCVLKGNYTCVEMISKVRNEEIVPKNGKGT